MARPENDRKCQGEEDEQNHQGDGDPEASTPLRWGDGGDRGGCQIGVWGHRRVETLDDLFGVQADDPSVALHEAPNEDVAGELVEAVRLEVPKHLEGDAGRLGELLDGDLP